MSKPRPARGPAPVQAAEVIRKKAKNPRKYVNPEHVTESRERLRAAYQQKFAEAAGVKLVPMKQSTAQKMMSMIVGTMGRREYIPVEIKFTKPSLVVGSDPTPGTEIDVCITASGEARFFSHRRSSVQSGASLFLSRAPNVRRPR